MKAIVQHGYGEASEVLRLEDVDRPEPGDDEVLVKIAASSVNGGDYHQMRGTPRFARVFLGIRGPKFKIPGCDIAGTVEAVGSKVTKFKPGDEVFGDISGGGFGKYGGFAEFVAAPEKDLQLRPSNVGFEEAASFPQAAVIALQSLRYKRGVRQGDKVLITGAGGGAGVFAIQMAKSFGAEVTGVDNTEKQDTMRDAGADRVIDYAQEDFTRGDERYDVIADLAAHRSIFACRRVMAPGGAYGQAGGSVKQMMQAIFLGPLFSIATSKKMGYVTHKPNTNDLAEVKELIEAGKLKPVIDREFPLSETAEAIRYCEDGHARGNVVIKV